ncbi:endonuclease MutS2 [uncultured Faecalibaculum sp.]|uniref:endonuclease MutS2 n=2 Tax=uncultured Faecalibaculum sp. TaxID=1729681 RepID=UPI002629DBEF|nr:Smr/MutS family protein [uncultured Faecalibaculum sp.]
MRNDNSFRQELDQALDLGDVLSQIAGYASFSGSARRIRESLPVTDRLFVRGQLDLAREARDFAQNGQSASLAGITDIRELLQMAEKGQVLTTQELLEIYLFLRAAAMLADSFDQELYPGLAELADSLVTDSRLESAIAQAVGMDGTLKSDASPTLVRLNRELAQAKSALAARGREFVKKNSSALMETMTTSIAGRLCVLVKAQDKYRFGGMIHGSSQSGQAFYVEPSTFVEANSHIQSLQAEIEEEKHRICRELSRRVGAAAFTLESDFETVTEIDTALAKGRWVISVDGSIPSLQDRDLSLRLIHAAHPLLDREKAVANDYRLKAGQQVLMISGPNMGGKTVTLKTVGLCAVLAQSGFPVPAHEALLPWYEDMWFDIGDNQSISENLSTFSSHMTRISSLVNGAGKGTFALLDEVGNGTDPLEGASLAVAVLENLIQSGATVLTSTHYSQVKSWGKADPAVLVSSMEFDAQSLKPTYRYVEDVSGASYAFDIAARCGLKPEVIERARQRKELEASQVERELENLERLQETVRKKEERFGALIEDAHRLQKEADQEKAKAQKERSRLREDYAASLDAMLEEKRTEAERIIQDLKGKEKLHELVADRTRLNSLQEDEMLLEPAPSPAAKNHVFKVGDYVRLTGLNTHGEILNIRRKEATVLANGIKTRVKLSALEPMARPVVTKSARTHRVDSVASRFPSELNLIGMHVEEGLQALDRYLDQAVVHHASVVRIIHGMGTGKLRAAVWKDLSRRNTIKKYEAAGPSEGGLGATIVTLR